MIFDFNAIFYFLLVCLFLCCVCYDLFVCCGRVVVNKLLYCCVLCVCLFVCVLCLLCSVCFCGRVVVYELLYCIRIRTRGGIYGKIWPEPAGAAQRQSQGLRPYFTVYPDLSPNMDIILFITIIY